MSRMKEQLMEFHVCKSMRDKCKFDKTLFQTSGNVILANFKAVRLFAKKINDTLDPVIEADKMISAGQLNAMGLIDEIFHYVCRLYRRDVRSDVFEELLKKLEAELGKKAVDKLLRNFTDEFPPVAVYQGKISRDEYLAGKNGGVSARVTTIEEMMLLFFANENPAFAPFNMLFNDDVLATDDNYFIFWEITQDFFKTQGFFGPNMTDLISMLREPIVFSPHSLKGQLDYIRTHWADLLGEWLMRLLSGMDLISEEEKPGWSGNFSDLPPMEAYNYDSLMKEYERFSPDKEWMPRVVLMAKTVLVWLDQLSKKYQRSITRLDQIPDEELDALAQEGFTGLWLIGLWERSWASKRIKQICGNPEAASSAYSLHDYEIAQNLGGWEALDNLRRRLWYRGIRLASDMVPNHTAMDSKWVVEKPDLFIQRRDNPFPQYTFTGENLSLDSRITVQLEDHYYSHSDCAVVYKRTDNATGDVRYIYHGNDGTGLPWNDTAQIDFLNPKAREEVIQQILNVARNFPIIRFDAAMVLAKKHIRRLWYPEPGQGGDIATRSESAISRDDFEKAIPEEFWREVVDRCAKEVPDTLLLAEAFWMMEGYFTRTLGMHRVYNSAFMNMLKKEENQKYRDTVKNTLEFDPQVLKRFVNFMNNPDEETAVAQFGKGDKYFGVCTLMVTMPGLPMFGHGQIEGFTEKYGMEYQKAYWDETPDPVLFERHQREIFPLMKKRYLFAEVENFLFYDVWDNGIVNENVFAYSNCYKNEKSVVFYNNVYQQASGWIKGSTRFAVKDSNGNVTQKTSCLAEGLKLHNEEKYFVIFQEQRTGMWYIRRSTDIFEKGLYVYLNGFESQVLLNISEVKDDVTGKYEILHNTLDGRGVPDIEVALMEIFLKELYAEYSKFACPEFFASIKLACMSGVQRKVQKIKAPKLSEILSKAEVNGKAFYKMVETFIEGNYGFDTVIDKKKAGIKHSAENAWKKFTQRITRLVKIAENAQKTSAGEKNLDVMLYDGMFARPCTPEIFAGYTMLYSMREVIGENATAQDVQKLIKLWGLDRKFRDALNEYGVLGFDTFAITKELVEVTANADFDLTTKHLDALIYLGVRSLFDSDNAVIMTGLNVYNNIRWFNKERTDDTLWCTQMIYALYSLKSQDEQLFMKVINKIAKAKLEAEYKADKFIELLKPSDEKLEKYLESLKPKVQKKKAAAKKTSAKKTETKAKATVKKAKTGTQTKVK